mgnify:CR=1 FL=1
MPMSAVLGTVFMEITFGVYMLSAALPMYIVRKPGFAVFGALVAAGVNLLMGSPYGLQLVLAGFLEGLGVEIGYAILGKYEGNLKNMISGQILGAAFVFFKRRIFLGNADELRDDGSGRSNCRSFSEFCGDRNYFGKDDYGSFGKKQEY